MKQLRYFYFGSPLYTKDTGVERTPYSDGEQIYELSNPAYRNPEQMGRYQKSYYSEHLPDDLDMDAFELHPDARLTSVLSSMFLNTTGLFISPQMYEFLQAYKAYNIKYYPLILNRGNEKIRWYYMHVTDSSKDLVDYPLSEFALVPRGNRTEILENVTGIIDYNDYIGRTRELRKSGNNTSLVITKCVLKEEYDIVSLPYQVDVFVSQLLMEKLEKELVTWKAFREFIVHPVFVK